MIYNACAAFHKFGREGHKKYTSERKCSLIHFKRRTLNNMHTELLSNSKRYMNYYIRARESLKKENLN